MAARPGAAVAGVGRAGRLGGKAFDGQGGAANIVVRDGSQRRVLPMTIARVPSLIDGAAISANVGVNPSLTISALAERAMSLIPWR